jgi:ferredoxin
MKVKRKIIQIDEDKCDGCGVCVPSCAEGAIQIVDGKARIVDDRFCDGLGACMGECPRDALTMVEKETEEFDPEAVEEHLRNLETQEESCPSGVCPSSKLHTFETPRQQASDESLPESESMLTNWPVKIQLVPPKAPFLKGADLLILADCMPVAFPTLHRDFLAGKTVLIGCPKFSDAEEYIDKFAGIFAEANIKSVTVAVMEVPCCSGLPAMVKKGMEKANRQVPMEKIVISAKGEILEKKAA